MTETREQWIEREARKARERWRGCGSWDEVTEDFREDWRNVVAPFYQEPLRVPVDVDKFADTMRRAQGHFWNWKNISEDSQEGWRRSARAALAYLNIEPCAKPEYDPADVALTPNERNELENLRAECKRLRTQRREWINAEVDELQRRLDAMVAMLEQNKPKPKHDDFHPFDIDQWNEAVCQWQRKADIYARAVAIAEGRDNG